MPASRFVRVQHCAAACLFAAMPAFAQQVRVLPVENVRVGYAQVLRVEPVYQTLRATAVVPDCAPVAATPRSNGTLSRIKQAVKGAITRAPAEPQPDCPPATVQRTYRTPIAYDVDYIYKGMKFRSRMATDPGNMLRVRVSVTPYEAADSAED